MAQFARPDGDISAGGWTPTPLYLKLDEVAPDDFVTEVTSENNPSSDAFEVVLSDTFDPQVPNNHIISIRARKDGPRSIDITWELKEGATVIASATFSASDTYITVEETLNPSDVNNISDYSNLNFRVVANDLSGSGDDTTAKVTWIEFEVPDDPGAPSVGRGLTSILLQGTGI